MSENINPEELRKDLSDVETPVVDTVPAEETVNSEPAQDAGEDPAPEPEQSFSDKVEELIDKVGDSVEKIADKVEDKLEGVSDKAENFTFF